MRRLTCSILVLFTTACLGPSRAERRACIDDAQHRSLASLQELNPDVHELVSRARAYGVFTGGGEDDGCDGGGGTGVLVRADGQRSYVRFVVDDGAARLGSRDRFLLLVFHTDEAFARFSHERVGNEAGGSGGTRGFGREVSVYERSADGLEFGSDLDALSFVPLERLNAD